MVDCKKIQNVGIDTRFTGIQSDLFLDISTKALKVAKTPYQYTFSNDGWLDFFRHFLAQIRNANSAMIVRSFTLGHRFASRSSWSFKALLIFCQCLQTF